MRLLAISVLALATLPASAQPVGMVGPRLAPADVRVERFDAAFEVRVTDMPSTPVLWNQTPAARWDAVVCNVTAGATGAVKAEETARWGHLDPNVCTMFANVAKLDLATVTADKPWTAKVFLRAHPSSR
jgi:ribosomal protein L11